MLAKLELKLKSTEEIVYQMSSLFHGALMEVLSGDYAEYLHISQLHPFTQHLELKNGAWYWVVCALNKEAVQKVIQDALMKLDSIFIKNRNMTIDIIEKNYSELTY